MMTGDQGGLIFPKTNEGPNKFVFVAPAFNAAETLPRMLYSLAGQSYDAWRVVLIDDVSNDHHRSATIDCVKRFNDLMLSTHADTSERIKLILNDEKKWEVANVLMGIAECKNDDIVCRIDADDWLTDLDTLAMIDATYQQTGCDALWTAHRWAFSDKNISGPLPQGADPYRHPWVSSHLKTFRKYLLNDIKDENFRGEDGNYIRRSGDQAIFLPVLNNSKKHCFLPRVCYHYTIKDEPATYQTDDARFQRDEALFLRSRGYVK
jgi:glycosyltransferase involved in cell wall biosynthesis